MDQLLITIEQRQKAARRVLENVFRHLYFDTPVDADQTQALFTVSGCLASLDREIRKQMEVKS